MNILKLILRNKREKRKLTDFYQTSIEKAGRDQIKRMVEKGINLPVIML